MGGTITGDRLMDPHGDLIPDVVFKVPTSLRSSDLNTSIKLYSVKMPIESELSRNQMVVPFGVGASYDYLNFSAISLLDYWEIPNEGNTFNGLKLNNQD